MAAHLENEAALVGKAQMGCAESFAVLVRQYERQIYRLSYAVTGAPGEAEDVLQETFLKAYANIGHFRGESRFYTWLVRIATNAAIAKLRRRHRCTWVSRDEPNDDSESVYGGTDVADWRDNQEESYSKTELRAILAGALLSLEAPLRIVFALRDIEDLSVKDTAKALGLSVPAVKSRLMRARLKLRKKLSFRFNERSALAAG